MEDLDLNLEPEVTPPTPPPAENSNRTFFIVAGILGAIAVFALICIAVIVLVWFPQRKARDAMLAATVNAQNTQVAEIITQTSDAAIKAAMVTVVPTSTQVPATETPKPSPTLVLAVAPTKAPTQDPRTPTVAALLTQAAISTQTVYPTATALPETGFAEDVGLPGMLGLAAVLIVVIFMARRLRTALP